MSLASGGVGKQASPPGITDQLLMVRQALVNCSLHTRLTRKPHGKHGAVAHAQSRLQSVAHHPPPGSPHLWRKGDDATESRLGDLQKFDQKVHSAALIIAVDGYFYQRISW